MLATYTTSYHLKAHWISIFFIEGNDFFYGCDLSSANPHDVVRDIVELAYYVVHCTKEAFVLGVQEGNRNMLEAQTSYDDILEALAKMEPEVLWRKNRSKTTDLSTKRCFISRDKTHLNARGQSKLHRLIRKVLRTLRQSPE